MTLAHEEKSQFPNRLDARPSYAGYIPQAGKALVGFFSKISKGYSYRCWNGSAPLVTGTLRDQNTDPQGQGN